MLNAVPPVTIFEDEDEAALKAEFIRMWAKHKQTRSPYEIAKYVFRNQREPELRAGQAAQVWATDLEVLEAVDEAILRGSTPKVDSLEDRLKTLKGIYDDIGNAARDRVNAIRVAGELQGEIQKNVNKKVEHVAQLPVFNIMMYAEDE